MGPAGRSARSGLGRPLVGKGLANGEIARELYINEVTVKAHLGHVLTKLGLRDRAAAIVYAFDSGVVAPGG